MVGTGPYESPLVLQKAIDHIFRQPLICGKLLEPDPCLGNDDKASPSLLLILIRKMVWSLQYNLFWEETDIETANEVVRISYNRIPSLRSESTYQKFNVPGSSLGFASE